MARTPAVLAPAELTALLAELDGRGRPERRLTALATLAGRQPGHLAERIDDPDPVVRCQAHRVIA
ncbi:hypothetical protein ACFRMQ_14765 [Kitasatospora sp. NPDC056783]|uniref:hypothetical protein n=1 Tax=Kitasatospora sp. NPDC056783 TaxID=3345943 RepID=UPI0036B4E813